MRPRVDPTLKIVEFAKTLVTEVLSGLLTANAVVALEDDGRAPIQLKQCVVMCLVEKVRSVDLRK